MDFFGKGSDAIKWCEIKFVVWDRLRIGGSCGGNVVGLLVRRRPVFLEFDIFLL